MLSCPSAKYVHGEIKEAFLIAYKDGYIDAHRMAVCETMSDFNYEQCKNIDCPYAGVAEKLKKEPEASRIRKLTEAMELIKDSYSLNMQQVLFVMGSLYDFVLKNYPEKARLVSNE